MTINDKINDEKLQYNIKREAAQISALLSGKTNKYEYLMGEEILLSNQKQIIEKAKFTNLLLRKAFEKQTKTIEDQGNKQVESIKEHGKQLAESNALINKYDYDAKKDSTLIIKQKEIFNKLINER